MLGKFLQEAQCLKLKLIKTKRVVPGRHRIGLSGWLYLISLYAGTVRQSTPTSCIRLMTKQSNLKISLRISTLLPGSLVRSEIRNLTVSKQVCTPIIPSPQFGSNGIFCTTMAAVTRQIRIFLSRRLSVSRQMVDWSLRLVESGLLPDS